MPLAAGISLAPPPSDNELCSSGRGPVDIVDPLNFVEVIIPVTFPGDLSLSLNCITVHSSSSSQSSPSSFSPSVSSTPSTSYSSSQNDETSVRSSFLPIDEEDSEDLETILRGGDRSTSYRDDYTECGDLDLEDVDFDEFEEDEGSSGHGQVTSTTTIFTLPILSTSEDDEEEDEEEEEVLVENPNPVPCIHCQGGKGHSIPGGGELIWPIQLDLDLIRTLVGLCPNFFDDFDEVEMDPMDLTSSSTSSATEDPSSSPSSSSVDTQGNISSSTSNSYQGSGSPPNVQVDDSPLQPSMDRNKESLKVKLLLRRPMTQLIEQGILPPSKTPPGFAEQRVRLERARMGDLLKAKIQQRPARQELIRQHILEECDARVAPSLAEKQRMLKRARLADSLNDHLIHRPGPLELVQKNILHAPDAIIDQAIKEGVVPFKATYEGTVPGPHVPSNIYLSEDESSSSDLSSPAGTPDQSQSSSSSVTETQKGPPSHELLLPVAQSPTSTTLPSPAPPPIPVQSVQTLTTSPVVRVPIYSNNVPPPPAPPLPSSPAAVSHHIQNELLSKIVKAAVTSSTTPPITSAQLTLSKLSSLEHQQLLSAVQQNQPPPRTLSNPQGTPNAFSQQYASTGKTRTTKKSTPKIKATPKARQIKFHEYKGPPSAQKGQHQTPQQEVESSYELLLQQQQLFLQWQLECRHKYPQIILPAVSKLASPTEVAASFATAVNAAAAVSMVPSTIVTAATASAPLVRSPSSTISIMNSNNTGTSGQQPIAPAPPPPITVQALVEKYNKNAATVTATLPLKFTVPTSSNAGVTEIRPKLTPSRSSSVSMDTSSSSSPSGPSPSKSTSHLDITKLNDWKVSDLKAELKKRNLPVSGAKPQLIERLKLADVSLQDESISSSSSNGIKLGVKSEVQAVDTESCSSSEMMDMSETGSVQNSQGAMSTGDTTTTTGGTEVGNRSNVAALNAAMLTLLQNNNLQNNGVIPVHILNALANVAKNANVNAGSNGKTQNIVVVDEKLIREQQIAKLQQALKNTQPQNPQIKITPQAGAGQKHRIALQQHLQQKMQQQALQSQLQKLIQLHTLQQQQQQAAHAQNSSAQKPCTIQTSPQQAQIQILPQLTPQTAIERGGDTLTLTLHQSDEAAEEKSSKINGLTATHVPMQTTDDLLDPQINNVPFRIVPSPQLELTTNPEGDEEGATTSNTDFSNIPQLQIHEIQTPAFRTAGESDSSQSTTKSGSFSSESGDLMDHSWLLKINEAPPTTTTTEPRKSVVKEFANFFDSFASGEIKKEEPKLQIPKPRRGFKSQMVDDVLEILIRNGELPPSAAQDPSTPPTTIGKLPSYPPPPLSSIPVPSALAIEEPSSKLTLAPPPPPPLPPPTFAVTLPTSITFSRSPTASNPSLQNPFPSELISREGKVKGPPPPYPADSSLSKEAQDILKISQDLSNFGKAHAQASSHHFSPSNQPPSATATSPGIIDYDSNTFAMLLDEVEKDAMSSLDMDMDHHHQFPVTGFHHPTGDQEMPEDQQNGRIVKQGDLLDELGTLLPPDLDVSMPMEMDYSDWLDQLLPENQSGIGEGTTTLPSSVTTTTLPVTSTPNPLMTLNNNFFMDYHDNFGNRDPLLSSSFNIFSGDGGGSRDNELKPVSPMAIGDNLLWDFF